MISRMRELLLRISALFKRRRLDDDLEQELATHLSLLTDQFLREGMSKEDATYAARRQFGGIAQVKQELYEIHGFLWIQTVVRDAQHAIRWLWKSPGFTATAVATLALGIGTNTAIFSVVNTILLKPVNAPDPDRIVQFEDVYSGSATSTVSPGEFNIWRQQTSLFQDVSAHWLDHLNLTGTSNPELIPAARVTADFFRLYGAPVLHGRTFDPDEGRPNGNHVVVLSYGLWARRFGTNPGIVGKTISLSGTPYVVIGVLGRNFNTEQFDQNPDVWVPFQIAPETQEIDPRLCFVTGRLEPGITLEMARAELRLIADEYRRASPGRMRSKDSFTAEPLRDAMVGDVRPSLFVLLGAVGFVLLIACANVANLLLVRAAGRKREIAIRAAVGASRGRIIRQLLTEGLVLSLAGTSLGLALGAIGIRALLVLYPSTPLGVPTNPINLPRIGQAGSAVTLDWRVVAFTVLVSVIAAVLFGLVPALQTSRANLSSALKDSSGRSGTAFHQNKTRALFIVSQMALALILLIGAALLIRTSIALQSVNPGFDSHNVLTMQMSLAGRLEQTQGMDQVVRGGIQLIGTLPGVETATSSCCLPLETGWQLPFIIAGRPLNGRFHGFAGWTFISPGYFDVLKIPILRGRSFTERDDAGAPGVVVINQEMARRNWPAYPLGRDPLNDRLLLGRSFGPAYEKDPVRQIVGIVGDVHAQALNRNPRPEMYVPIAQLADGVKAIVLPILPIAWIVRTRVEPHSLSSTIRDELRQASGGLPVAQIRSMEEVAAQSTVRTRFNMWLMTIFGGSALLLAAVGIYGVMAYSVEQRTQEIGIRLALGAGATYVQNIVLFEGMRLTLLGVAIGGAVAFGLTRLLASSLFGVQARDPVSFIAAPVLLSAVAVLAVWIPARRATRVDPAEALRYE